MSVQEYNVKIENTDLGNTKIGKSLWSIFYGVELEYEIDINHSFISKWLKDSFADTVSIEKAINDGEPGNKRISKVMQFAWQHLHPKIKEFAFVKRDGSLKNGLEVVTVPMTIDSHETSWPDALKKSKSIGLVVRDTCGMHVHASRENLSSFQCGKILYFLHNDKNRKFVIDIAGRIPPDNYANFVTKKKITDVNSHTLRKDALNLTGDKTIEFRFFASTLEFERVMANIQFCAALINFCWPSNSSLQNLNVDGFLKFIEIPAKRKEYSHLFKLLKDLGYLKQSNRKVLPNSLVFKSNIKNDVKSVFTKIPENLLKKKAVKVKKDKLLKSQVFE